MTLKTKENIEASRQNVPFLLLVAAVFSVLLSVTVAENETKYREDVLSYTSKYTCISNYNQYSHMALSDAKNYCSSRPHRFPRKYKSAETF
jgi:hypothetical protein